jgi:hypothetical protein
MSQLPLWFQLPPLVFFLFIFGEPPHGRYPKIQIKNNNEPVDSPHILSLSFPT